MPCRFRSRNRARISCPVLESNGAGRLISQQNSRMGNQRPCNGYLLLTTGKLVGFMGFPLPRIDKRPTCCLQRHIVQYMEGIFAHPIGFADLLKADHLTLPSGVPPSRWIRSQSAAPAGMANSRTFPDKSMGSCSALPILSSVPSAVPSSGSLKDSLPQYKNSVWGFRTISPNTQLLWLMIFCFLLASTRSRASSSCISKDFVR